MNTETFAGRSLKIFILFLSGLAFGLFLTVTGRGVASDAEGQLGGGIAFFIGWGITYLGYFVMIVSVLAAGISWVVVAVKSRVGPQRIENSDDSNPVHAKNSESSGPKSTFDSN
jgi:hypothetical protein